jgi:hypothetical protein
MLCPAAARRSRSCAAGAPAAETGGGHRVSCNRLSSWASTLDASRDASRPVDTSLDASCPAMAAAAVLGRRSARRRMMLDWRAAWASAAGESPRQSEERRRDWRRVWGRGGGGGREWGRREEMGGDEGWVGGNGASSSARERAFFTRPLRPSLAHSPPRHTHKPPSTPHPPPTCPPLQPLPISVPHLHRHGFGLPSLLFPPPQLLGHVRAHTRRQPRP